MLRQLGYNADSVSDGDAALIKYKESMNTKKYDFIILDLTIPGKMGGKEAIKRLLEIDPDAAAIVSSGYSNDPILSNYSEYGFKGCLIKPYRIEELFDAIKKIK